MGNLVKKLIAIAIGGGLLFVIGSRVYDARQAQNVPTKKKKGGRTVSVRLTKVALGEVNEQLTLTGALKAKELVDVTPKGQGRLEKLYFQVGDRVKQGDLIAELEDDELQQRVRRAEAAIAVSSASVAQRQAELSNVRANLGRSDQLFDEGLLSPQEHEQQKTSLAMVEAQVQLADAQKQQSEAELRELNIQLDQTKIYAPMVGDVSLRYVDQGALVNPNSPIIQVVNLSTMVIQGNVPERDVGKLRVGNVAEVSVDAIPDKIFHGRVARIAPVLDPATRSALIEIDISNVQRTLKAEMFARIQLDLGTMREATLIPRDGLVYRGSQSGVYIVEGDNNKPVFRPIETGMTLDNSVEVLANLKIGDTIVGRGATMLNDGDQITVAGAGGRGKGGKGGSPTGGATGGGGSEGGGEGEKGGGAQKKAAVSD